MGFIPPIIPLNRSISTAPCAAARVVQLAGDFNHWHPILMERREDGWWFIQIWLPHGHHQYRFLADGEPMLDLHATGTGPR